MVRTQSTAVSSLKHHFKVRKPLILKLMMSQYSSAVRSHWLRRLPSDTRIFPVKCLTFLVYRKQQHLYDHFRAIKYGLNFYVRSYTKFSKWNTDDCTMFRYGECTRRFYLPRWKATFWPGRNNVQISCFPRTARELTCAVVRRSDLVIALEFAAKISKQDISCFRFFRYDAFRLQVALCKLII